MISIFTVRAMVPCGPRPCRPGHWASEYPRRPDTWHAHRCQTQSARASAVYSPHLVNWSTRRIHTHLVRDPNIAESSPQSGSIDCCSLKCEVSHPSQAHWKLVDFGSPTAGGTETAWSLELGAGKYGQNTDDSSGTGCSRGHDARMG